MVSGVILAAEHRSKLKVKIINHTISPFTFSKVTGENPDNKFRIHPATVQSKTHATIVGSTSTHYDLQAYIHFKDENSHDVVLRIRDYRQLHPGQPVFYIDSPKYHANVISETFNPKVDPGALSYVAAEVEILEK